MANTILLMIVFLLFVLSVIVTAIFFGLGAYVEKHDKDL